LLTRTSMRPNCAIAVSVIFCAVAQSPISPSTSARRGEGVKFVDLLMAREFPTTLYPYSKKRVTRPAPIPCDPPVTIAVPVVDMRLFLFYNVGIEFLRHLKARIDETGPLLFKLPQFLFQCSTVWWAFPSYGAAFHDWSLCQSFECTNCAAL
jgi:hypothetical protein